MTWYPPRSMVESSAAIWDGSTSAPPNAARRLASGSLPPWGRRDTNGGGWCGGVCGECGWCAAGENCPLPDLPLRKGFTLLFASNEVRPFVCRKAQTHKV